MGRKLILFLKRIWFAISPPKPLPENLLDEGDFILWLQEAINIRPDFSGRCISLFVLRSETSFSTLVRGVVDKEGKLKHFSLQYDHNLWRSFLVVDNFAKREAFADEMAKYLTGLRV